MRHSIPEKGRIETLESLLREKLDQGEGDFRPMSVNSMLDSRLW